MGQRAAVLAWQKQLLHSRAAGGRAYHCSNGLILHALCVAVRGFGRFVLERNKVTGDELNALPIFQACLQSIFLDTLSEHIGRFPLQKK